MKKFALALCLNFVCLFAYAQVKAYDTIPYALDYHQQRVAIFEKEPITKGKIIFLGDSHIEFGDWKKHLKDSAIVNRGVAGDNTFGVLARLQDVIDRNPTKLLIEIGINDISQNIPERVIAENIFKIVKKAKGGSPGTRIFVSSILPTNQMVKLEYPDAFNKNKNAQFLNQLLKSNAKQIEFTYIDLYEHFQDKNGELNVKYAEKDGLHLNTNGYQLWIEVLKKKGYFY